MRQFFQSSVVTTLLVFSVYHTVFAQQEESKLNSVVLYRNGIVCLEKGDYGKAIDWFEATAKKFPGSDHASRAEVLSLMVSSGMALANCRLGELYDRVIKEAPADNPKRNLCEHTRPSFRKLRDHYRHRQRAWTRRLASHVREKLQGSLPYDKEFSISITVRKETATVEKMTKQAGMCPNRNQQKLIEEWYRATEFRVIVARFLGVRLKSSSPRILESTSRRGYAIKGDLNRSMMWTAICAVLSSSSADSLGDAGISEAVIVAGQRAKEPDEDGSFPGRESPKVYEFWAVEVKPVLLQETYGRPEYPEQARGSGIEGKVVLRVVIEATGNVVDVRVVESLHESCDTAAVRAARKWKYSPGEVNGKPVRVRIFHPVSFTIQQ